MAVRLKPLDQQTIVITGAASGIGLTTARMAVEAGARVVAVARDAAALEALERELNAAGPGRAAHAVADVSDEAAVRRVVDLAVERFGGIDTWVNCAAVGVYGRVTEISLDDARRLMDVNFWGQVYGSLAAVRHVEQRRQAGAGGGDGSGNGARGYGLALVNVGSTVSDRALPLQSYYGASKHALKGFTDALRMELEEAGVPVSVTLVKPGSIDTPFVQHAANYMPREGNYPPPVYAPQVVARAILHAAAHPRRDLFAGGGGWAISALGRFLPRLTDVLMERTMFRAQQQDAPPSREDALRAPGAYGGQERGTYPGLVRRRSLFTEAQLHPAATRVGLAVACAAAAIFTTRLLHAREPEPPPSPRYAAPGRRLARAAGLCR